MPRSVLPSGDCVFRLDSEYGFNQAFPMTFNDVGLSDDGFEFDGESSYVRLSGVPYYPDESTVIISFNSDLGNWKTGIRHSSANILFISHVGKPMVHINSSYNYGSPWDMGDNHLAITFKNDEWKMYQNSELTKTFSEPYFDSPPSFIGKTDNYYFNGTIKHVSIYNRALTAQEVADRYNEVTFQFLNDTPTPTQQNYLDFWDNRKIGRQ